MSRLRPSSADVPTPAQPVDTEIPCFTADVDDEPTLLPVEDLVALQLEDDGCQQISLLLGNDSSLDVDHAGTLGHILPSGEFQVIMPHALESSTPIAVIQDTSLVRGDAHELGREEVQGINHQVKFSRSTVIVTPTEVLPQALQLDELIREQATDPDCQEYSTHTGKESLFDHDASGLLIRRAPLDGTLQIVVPATLRPRLLHLEHYPRTAGHPGVTRMFRTLRRRYFWKRMSADVSETVRECVTCAKNRVKERNRTSFLKLFPASEPLEYVSIDILGPLPKTDHGNRFLLVLTDRFSKLTRTVPLRTTSAFVVAKAFCDHWVFVYGPPRYVLTDNGPQFTAKFFLAVCRELGIDKVFTTAYHPQTNGQVERFNRTIVNSLRGYVAERQEDWDEYTAAITFGYNCRIHSSLGLAPFELVLSRPPPPLSVEYPDPGIEGTPDTAKLRFLKRIKELRPLALRRLAEAQARYKRNYDRTIREKNNELGVGSWVYVRRETHDTGINPKLDEQVDGPYQVLNNDGHTFLLQLGDQEVRISSDRITPAPTPRTEMEIPATQGDIQPITENSTDDTEEPEYVFEKIVGARRESDGSLRYRIRWYGYGRDEDTWEPASHLPGDVIRRYHRKTGLPYSH
jgi:transposase InsO family protein